MTSQPEPDLIKVTEIFLVPSSFLVAALGTADSNPHRALVSLLGLIISILWWVCSHDAIAERRQLGSEMTGSTRTRRTSILGWLPAVFATGWLMSTIVHTAMWNRTL